MENNLHIFPSGNKNLVLDLFMYPFQMYCTIHMMYLLYLDVLYI